MKWMIVLPTLLVLATPALAQRGMGEDVGVARSGVAVATRHVSGVIQSVEVEPCPLTTGRADVGVHVFLATEGGESLNVHLGPQFALLDVVEMLEVGDPFEAEVFSTALLPEDAAIARSITSNGTEIALRDATGKPVWSGGPGRGMRQGRGPGRDFK